MRSAARTNVRWRTGSSTDRFPVAFSRAFSSGPATDDLSSDVPDAGLEASRSADGGSGSDAAAAAACSGTFCESFDGPDWARSWTRTGEPDNPGVDSARWGSPPSSLRGSFFRADPRRFVAHPLGMPTAVTVKGKMMIEQEGSRLVVLLAMTGYREASPDNGVALAYEAGRAKLEHPGGSLRGDALDAPAHEWLSVELSGALNVDTKALDVRLAIARENAGLDMVRPLSSTWSVSEASGPIELRVGGVFTARGDAGAKPWIVRWDDIEGTTTP